ncbi:hypothetical protein ACTXT7_017488, partial [Hymenolepis weldensis]
SVGDCVERLSPNLPTPALPTRFNRPMVEPNRWAFPQSISSTPFLASSTMIFQKSTISH